MGESPLSWGSARLHVRTWGPGDGEPLDQGERLADELADGRLAVVAGAAHTPFLTHPDEVAELVADHASD